MMMEQSERGAGSQRVGRDSLRNASASSPSANLTAGPSAETARPRRRSPLPIDASAEELRIGEVDVVAVREVLVEIGTGGAASLDALSPAGTIALLARLRDLSGAVAAVQARALVRLEEAVAEDCRRCEETPKQALKVARSEASKALKQSTSCAAQSMATSRRLVRSMPGMLAALAQGRIVAVSAHRVGRTLGPASPEQRSQVDEILGAHLPYLEDCGPEEWAGEAEKVLHGLDPHGAADRHRTAKKDRSVTVRRSEHGMSTVTARLSGLDGARIRKGLSIAAEKARAHGDRRGHQQIMADLFADALIGRGEGIDPSTLEIGVIITDRSLLAPDHADAATIEGFGAVAYEHIREEMREAMSTAEDDPELAPVLRRLYADPDDGQLVAVDSTARAFPPALARFLRIAHQTCRAPYCDANIRQNDHIIPWSEGGPTSLDNGNGLCVANNQKEIAGERARVVRDENGTRRTVEWTSRYGQKARRRGINYDPVGTGARLLRRASAEAVAHASRRGGELGPPGAPQPPASMPDTVKPRGGGADGGSAAAPHASLRRAIARVAPSPGTAPPRGARHPRRDHIFFPHLTVVTETPWHGPEADAA